MSQYTNFFLKGDDKFYSLGDWSRNSAIAEIANPHLSNKYDVAMYCSTSFLADLEDTARGKAKAMQERIIEYQKKIEMISKFDNSVPEKMDFISEYEECIEDCEEAQQAYMYACHYFGFLVELENPVYAGIECGEQPGEIIE